MCAILLIAMLVWAIFFFKIFDFKLYSPLVLFALPNIVICVFNNMVFVPYYGFNLIADSYFFKVLLGVIAFGMGCCCFKLILPDLTKEYKENSFWVNNPFSQNVNIILIITIILLVIDSSTILYKIHFYGLSAVMANDGYLLQQNGIIGGLRLITKTLLVVLFSIYVEDRHKKLNKIIPFIIIWGAIVVFSSFVKYHIITLVLFCFFFVGIRKYESFKKNAIITVVLIFSLFALNYLIIFLAYGNSIDIDFYIKHFWDYVAGGSINASNYLEKTFFDYFETDELFLQFASGFLQYIYSKISNGQILYFKSLDIGNNDIGCGHFNNVISTMGSIWASNSIWVSILLLFVLGMVSEFLSNLHKLSKSVDLRLFVAIFNTYLLLSFFANYWTLSSPFMELFISILVSIVFSKKTKKDNKAVYLKKALLLRKILNNKV